MTTKKHHEETDDQPDAGNAAIEEAAAGDTAAAPAPEETIDWKDRFLRAKADFANLQRRAREEQHLAVRFANADFARAFIEVLDDFERTLQAAETAEQIADVVTGVQMVHGKLLKALRDHHVAPIAAEGEAFDPQQHEALLQRDNADVPNGTVLQDVRRGYRLHDRVLRPSGVIVSRRPEAPAASEDVATDEE